MHPRKLIPIALLGVMLVTSGCKNYATVREKNPGFQAASPTGELLVKALKSRERSAEARMGHFIDAAYDASRKLKKNPKDSLALEEYNFAVARVFDVLHHSGLQPWKAPVLCRGASRTWRFSVLTSGKREHDPSYYRILPADRFVFRGSLVSERMVKPGIGAPMVIASKGFDPSKFDPFIQGKNVYYGITQVLHFRGDACIAGYVDPLSTEDVAFQGHRFPVAADFSAPIALALAELRPRRIELQRMFSPTDYSSNIRVARLQPYNPKKIPILCVHGLGDSQATWAPMIEALRGDETIRKNYQIWFYSYPTGYPYPLMAALLRKKLDEIRTFYPDHKPLVVIGHSMGGMISRALITDSGDKLWNTFFETPPEKTPLTEKSRELLVEALIFRHRPDVCRVIFASASHRGADMAVNFWGRMGRRLIGIPAGLTQVGKEMALLSKPREDGRKLQQAPNSIDVLDPNNRFVTTIDKIPPNPKIPFHSIIADRGKGGNRDHTKPQSTDGIVPYWSSHMPGAQSELIVPSGHWSNQDPQAIAEVKRILKLHLKGSSG
ncbi:MAG: alpha/beta hydrolase [Terrimicrobiaceae bacterium]